ncbi:Ig-like domain-containing protein [Serratia aquatilis]|uniref:Ig-like domain-containing protein n=1 Tax=Serratia aquatilis TaxID=1737515 RepID=A0ABV6EEH9_9GAMM
MQQKFFRIPFASNGDKQAVPDDKNAEGYVSFTEGWGEDYQKDMLSDAHAKAVERSAMNGILNAITLALRQYQTDAFPEWITPANNGGTAYPYGAGVVVRHRQGNGAFTSYVSLVDNNTAEPGKDANKWQGFIYRKATQAEADAGKNDAVIITPPTLQQSIKKAIGDVTTELAPFLLPVGIVVSWGGIVPPDGWIEANGQRFDIAKNPKLYAVYPSGQVPDLRGRFIRGWAHGSAEDADSGRGILSFQERSDLNHYHHTGRFGNNWGPQSDDGYFPQRGDSWDGESYSGRAICGDHQAILTAQIPESLQGPAARTFSTSNPRWIVSGETPVQPDLRPKNIAMMFIVKTDQADNIKPDPTPTNIVVTPASLNIGVASQRQFTAQVLPAELAPKFPVTWISTNTAVGTIDRNGLLRAVGPGNTDIIASVSSGLSVRVTVRVDVLLTSIAMGAIPDKVAGDSYSLLVSKTPNTATERLLFESSDNAVASVNADGQLIAVGEGSATISVTGDISRKSASRVVKVTAAPVVSDYLAIKNNLSEIAATGVKAQEASRANLGLKALAIKDSLTAADVGAVNLASKPLPAGTNLNSISAPGQYFQNVSSNATLALNYPTAVAGTLVVYKTVDDAGGCRQVYMPYNSTVEYRRFAFGSPLTWSPWSDKDDPDDHGSTNVEVDGSSLVGKGTTENPLAVKISTAPGNALVVSKSGLWATNTVESLTRNAVGYSFPLEVPDLMAALNSCGPLGKGGCYFRSSVPVMEDTYNIMATVYLESLPCLEDGTLVSYNTWCGPVTRSDGSYRVPVWLICQTIPTHTLNLSTGVIAPITRRKGASGLPNYPVVSDGGRVNIINYMVLQFYGKVKA